MITEVIHRQRVDLLLIVRRGWPDILLHVLKLLIFKER